MYKLGLSSCGKEFGDKLFEEYRKADIAAMEISYDKETCDSFDFTEALRLSQQYGVELWSFHLPFAPFSEIDISVPELREGTVEYFKTLIRKGTDIGIKVFVIHPSGEPIPDSERRMRMETSKKSLKELAQYTKTMGAVIAVEDLPRTCLGRNSEEILELISADESLRVCFDTNHLLSESIPHFIKSVGDKIITTHVSDYDFIDEKHWLPFEGKIDWKETAEALKDIGYSGPWLYELGFKAPETMPRERDLTCEDFKINAEKILNVDLV